VVDRVLIIIITFLGYLHGHKVEYHRNWAANQQFYGNTCYVQILSTETEQHIEFLMLPNTLWYWIIPQKIGLFFWLFLMFLMG
jgi:hypothetical protein